MNFGFCDGKYAVLNREREKFLGIDCFEILYTHSKEWINSNQKKGFLLGKGLRQTGCKTQVKKKIS